MAATVISNLSQADWTEEQISVFPLTWVKDTAIQPGGVLYTVFWSIAATAVAINLMIIYAYQAGLITTATDGALDDASKDFFGNGLPRLAGESDTAFRGRIQAQLLVPYITQPAFLQQIVALIGNTPRLIQPWIAGQTSAYDYSYYDHDSVNMPGIYGDPGMKYQIAVQALLPAAQVAPYGPVYSYDGGAAYDGWTGSYGADSGLGNINAKLLDQLLQRIKAAGITVWRKYLNAAPTNFGSTVYQFNVNQSLFYVPFVPSAPGSYYLFLSPNWLTNVWPLAILANGFNAESNVNTPSPQGGQVSALFVPTSGVAGVGRINVPANAQTITITTAQGSNTNYAVQANWNTSLYIISQSSTAITLAFSNAAPASGGTITWYNLQGFGGRVSPTVGALSATVTVPNAPMAAFALPNWNTRVALSRSGTTLTLSFDTPCPTNGRVQWGYVEGTF